MSKLITKESLTAYERWELPTVGTARSEEVEAEEVKPLTAAELDAIRQEAYREGFAEGRAEGWRSGEQQVKAEIQHLHQIMRALAEPLASVDEQVEGELLSLAIAIARQLIRRELKSEPGEVVAVVREALALLPAASRNIQLLLHPEDAALVREALALTNDSDSSWRIVEDPSLTRGGCRVVSEHSRIDATVEKRLNTVIGQLLGQERHHEAAGE